MVKPLFRTPPKRILVISLRHLGDVLLTTPLISSLRETFPEAKVDALVFRNTAAMLENNPDIHQVIAISARPDFSEYMQITRRIFRRYDLSVLTQTGDRPFLFSLLGSSKRIGLAAQKPDRGWWKRYFLKRWPEADHEKEHAILHLLRIMETVPGSKHYGLTPPRTEGKTANRHLADLTQDYAVLHVCARFRYKEWTRTEWGKVADHLVDKGLKIVLTGGPGTEETDYIAEFQRSIACEVTNLAGKTSLAELSEIIADARLFVGLDTGTTHLAAATGVPVVAIFGPTNPVMWAPWPVNASSDETPFEKVGSQSVGNIHLVQGRKFCVPCQEEGCDRHRNSRSECLDFLAAERVIRRIDAILAEPAAPTPDD